MQARRGHAGDHARQAELLRRPRHRSRCGSTRFARSASASCSPGSTGCAKLLDAEGLFDPRLKRPIPFLPNTIGLITGRASAAERDVMSVATGRWPAVRFAVRNTIVQGPNAVAQIVEALRELDADPDVDVIVHRPRRRQRRGPAAVLRRDAVPRDRRRAPRRSSAPSATNPTTRCATWSPTCAPPPRPTPPNASCPTPPPSRRCVRRPPQAQRAGAAQLGASRAAHAEPVAQPAGAGPAAGRAHRAGRGDPPRQGRRPSRHHPAGRPPRSERVGHLSARLATLGPAATLARGYAVVQRCAAGDAGCCARRPTRPRARGCGSASPTAPSPTVSEGSTNEAH